MSAGSKAARAGGAGTGAEADSDEDDYVFYGTKLHDEDETHLPSGNRADPATTRSLPVHQQIATDEQGRKRFHGAFTGGFSAGYYNTVGSKEGWAPSSFTSSRSNPAQRKQQAVEDFLDEDELEERKKRGMVLTAAYDTFGSSAAAAAAGEAAAAAAARPSVIPGAVPLEFFAPVSSSIGVQLLQRMGWRPGKGVGSKGAAAAAAAATRKAGQKGQRQLAADAVFGGFQGAAGFGGPAATSDEEDEQGAPCSSKWGAVAGVSIENTPMYVLEPKQDLHGLGFDPFEGAEVFRTCKRQKLASARSAADVGSTLPRHAGFGGSGVPEWSGSKARGVAFGTGVLEESDTLGYMEDYVDAEADILGKKEKRNEVFAFEEGSDSDDEDRFAPTRKTPTAARIAAANQDPTLYLQGKEQYTQHGSFIQGFKAASNLVQFPEYPPPKVPPDFVAFHKFTDSRRQGEGPRGTVGTADAASGTHLDELARAKAAATAAAAAAAAAASSGSDPALSAQAAAAAAAAAAATHASQHQWPTQSDQTPVSLSTAPAEVDSGAPPEVPAPEDAALVRQIDSLAMQVVRSGQIVEDLARKRAASTLGRYQFLQGGPGFEYYQWRLYSLKQQAAAVGQQQQQLQSGARHGLYAVSGTRAGATAHHQPRVPLTVDQRMALLGEAPLPASAPAPAASSDGSIQRKMLGQVAASDQVKLASALSSAFVKGAVQDMGQAYQQQQEALAGLRHMSKPVAQSGWQQQQQQGVVIVDDAEQPVATQAGAGPSEAVAAEAVAAAAAQAADLPVRTFEDWRPAPLLCKRFNVPDPYKGKAAPVDMPKYKTDFLALPDTAAAQATLAAAEEEQLRIAWQQQQQQQQGGSIDKAVDAATFLDDIMQEVHQSEALGEAAKQAKAAALAARQAANAAGQPGAGQELVSQAVEAVENGTSSGAPAVAAAAGASAAPAGAGTNDEEPVLPAVEKPLDLFKAIFEDVSESEDEQDEEGAAEQHASDTDKQRQQAEDELIAAGKAGHDRQQQQQQQQQQPMPLPGGKLAGSGAPGAKDLADAFLQKSQRPLVDASMEWQQQKMMQQSTQKEEILQALEALRAKTDRVKKQDKHKKHKKKHGKDKKKSKTSKHKGSKDKRPSSKHRKQHKLRHKDGSFSTDSSSNSDSLSDDSTG